MGLFEGGNHRVTLDFAAGLTRTYRGGRDSSAVGGAFARQIIDEILAQPGCTAIRYYFATHPEGRPTIVLVGVDAENSDLADGVIAEVDFPCPPFCSAPNPLNS